MVKTSENYVAYLNYTYKFIRFLSTVLIYLICKELKFSKKIFSY